MKTLLRLMLVLVLIFAAVPAFGAEVIFLNLAKNVEAENIHLPIAAWDATSQQRTCCKEIL